MNAELEMPEGAEIAPKERIDAGAGAAMEPRRRRNRAADGSGGRMPKAVANAQTERG